MIEIDDKHKQVLQWAVQAYYEGYLEMKKDRLEELEALEESLSEMRTLLVLLGYPPKKSLSEDARSLKETTPSVHLPQPVPMQQSGVVIADTSWIPSPQPSSTQQIGGDSISNRQEVEQIPPEIPKKSETEQNHASMDSPGPDNYGMRPNDLKLMSFDYDKNSMQQYKMIFFQELPDGKVVIEYSNSHYYTSKVAVMQINPMTFVMENVPAIQKFKLPDGSNLLKTFIKMVNKQDWDIYYEVQALFMDGNMDPDGECTVVPQEQKSMQRTLSCLQ